MIGNNNYRYSEPNNRKEYNLHKNERMLLLTLRQVNKMYNIVGDTNTHYLEFIREVTNYYSEIVDLLKDSDKYQGREKDQERF